MLQYTLTVKSLFGGSEMLALATFGSQTDYVGHCFTFLIGDNIHDDETMELSILGLQSNWYNKQTRQDILKEMSKMLQPTHVII